MLSKDMQTLTKKENVLWKMLLVGKHKGFAHYTIGKKEGFTVQGAQEPPFCYKIKSKDNTIVVGKKRSIRSKWSIGKI